MLHHAAAGPDQLLDGLGFGGGALRQTAHFGGHHRKAAALLPRTGCLDCRVERQNVGLESDAVDHANDVGDFLATGVDVVHGAHHLRHHFTALRCHAAGAHGQLVGLAGAVGVVANGGPQLLHAGGCFLQRAGLAFGATRKVLVALCDFGAGGRHAVGTGAHRAQAFHQAHAKPFHGLGQRPDFIAGADRHFMCEVALRQVTECRAQLLHRQPHQPARGRHQHHGQQRKRHGQTQPQPGEYIARLAHHFGQGCLGNDGPGPGLVTLYCHEARCAVALCTAAW